MGKYEKEILLPWVKDEVTGDYYARPEWGDSALGNWSNQTFWWHKDGKTWISKSEIEEALRDDSQGYGSRLGNYYPWQG